MTSLPECHTARLSAFPLPSLKGGERGRIGLREPLPGFHFGRGAGQFVEIGDQDPLPDMGRHGIQDAVDLRHAFREPPGRDARQGKQFGQLRIVR